MTYSYRIADDQDNPGIQKLIAQPIGDKWKLRCFCEPDLRSAFACEGFAHQSVIAQRNKKIIGHGARTIRHARFNGETVRLGYLSYLRKDASLNGIDGVCAIQDCMKLLRQQRKHNECDFDLTSIMADNLSAIRFLTHGSKNMPHYKQCSNYHSFIISCRTQRKHKIDSLSSVSLAPSVSSISSTHICDFVNRSHKDYILAPHCSTEDWKRLGHDRAPQITLQDKSGNLKACAVLWDQRAIKQHTISQLPARARFLRPVINGIRRIQKLPSLPKIHTPINHVFLSHCAADSESNFVTLMYRCLSTAQKLGIDHIVVGFGEGHYILPWLRNNFSYESFVNNWYLVQEHAAQAPTGVYHLEAGSL